MLDVFIRFYYLYIYGRKRNGIRTRINIATLYNDTQDLDWEERFIEKDNTTTIILHSDTELGTTIRGVLAHRRTRDLPSLEQRGEITQLTIPEGSGLIESSPFIIFKPRIIGIICSKHGPKKTDFIKYFKKLYKIPAFDLLPLIQQDIFEALSRMIDVKVGEFRVYRGACEEYNYLEEGLGSALKETSRRLPPTKTIEIIARFQEQRPENRRGFLQKVRRFTTSEHFINSTAKFKIEGKNAEGGKETFNPLKSIIYTIKQIATIEENGNRIDIESAFEAVEETFREKGEEILRTLSDFDDSYQDIIDESEEQNEEME